ncbi:MAG: hypothetical protein NTX64_10025 [Elusimicrobia bacterium]|nr:hypothetical protein [Elusimicrobiota bacterium]
MPPLYMFTPLSVSTPPPAESATVRPPFPARTPENVELLPSASIVPAPVSVTPRAEVTPLVVFSVPPLKARPPEH